LRYRHLFIFVIGLLPQTLHADDWPGAQVISVFSSDGTHFVRILPGSSWGDAQGFAGARKGEYARGLFYALQQDRSYRLVAEVTLANPVAPVDALVTKRGELITFDNWHNFGFGAVVAMFDSSGNLLASFSLEDLYPKERVSSIPRSVSSRWWRCNPFGFVDPSEQTTVYAFEHFGGTFSFSFSSRSFKYSPGKDECQRPAGPFSSTRFDSP
jgi:hypothetical protein